ncbi:MULTISPECIES: bifunctional 4-hydroxy-2-oxoglutarate aldolase/2-dehydro-3-deoxy-phosphogluconate aldolase [Terribacillus]|uniref:2-dehydro-3-deoxyphosphogluconate aldolase n=1 Tax=Terribacillus saccharophilus TaxID=361277 RepID=A0ABX4H093_9BACI|nr:MULTISPECIES: bifunctional 4-hydroxy-2-oxoglutarate aldolase/2-dehydro-3-deoxy-phosphogluconate aldolase [Terribacillus]PAD36066.1 2-dehydro-3-deoxyphosphogluconate aldolase [Terribacillus saccharophilus]PAD96884.1 2-dehydro-3-deoxyphosphogluconate aldolase [Terribacillus saccharophilus]PAE00460.1 2-dehydro-3-deoxyphosphogluconate aldolase [Terribacillus saccharophilus]
MDVLSTIKEDKLIAIIRGSEPEDALQIARALYAGGVRAIEITLNSPNALVSIEKVSKELGDKIVVGAGTVLDPESARSALIAGAQFILSPSLNADTIKMTKRYGAISIPGAFTPTEILSAYEEGGDIIKVFPATSLGPDFVKDIHGPLPHIPLLPTGGVDLSNIAEYIQKGAAGVGLGSSLVNSKESVTEEYLIRLTNTAREFKSKVESVHK